MKRGLEQTISSQKVNSEKLKKRMADIEKRMEKGDNAEGESKRMIENLQKTMTEITHNVEKGQKEQKKHAKALAAVQKQIQDNVEKLDDIVGEMVTTDQMDELQDMILNVNSKVVSLEVEIDR